MSSQDWHRGADTADRACACPRLCMPDMHSVVLKTVLRALQPILSTLHRVIMQ